MVEKQKVLLKRSSVPGKMPNEITSGTVDLGELFINIASGDAENFLTTLRAEGSSAVTSDYIKWSDDAANEKKFATKEEVMDNELVVSTIITKINESVGLDENSESVLPNGESLSDAIIELQSRTSIIEESDPIFTKSVAASITSGDISNWNNKLGKTEKAVSAKTSDSATTSVSATTAKSATTSVSATTAKSATTSVSATTAKSASTVSFSGIPTGKTSTTVARGDHSHTASELGLESALKYHGVTTTPLTDGATTNPITIGGVSHYQSAGCVVIYSTTASGDTEFIWNGSSWEKLGDGVNYKVKQTAVSSPSANGNATSFIDTISQDANGVITVTKKNITTASTSNLGLMKVGNFLTSTGGTVSVSTGTSNTTVARGDHAHANYALASDLNSLIEDVEDNEYVIATALNLINASAGFNEDGTSALPNGESLSDAIIELQSITSVTDKITYGSNNLSFYYGDKKNMVLTTGGILNTKTLSTSRLFLPTANLSDDSIITGFTLDIHDSFGSKMGSFETGGNLYLDGYVSCDSISNTTKFYSSTGSGKYYLLGTTGSGNSSTSILMKNSNVYMDSGDLYAASDKRLKTHIGNVNGDPELIKQIPKVYFHWNDDEDKKSHLGTYAQDVEEIYPELVTKDDEGIRGVAYDRMGVVALAGIDKLYEMIQELQTKNEELEKRIKDLEK